MFEETKFRLYSIGIVAIKKDPASTTIEATPIEHLSLVDGVLGANRDNVAGKHLQEGVEKTTEIKKEDTLTAEWIPFGQSNRTTPPDVREGETILLFTYGDTGEYWWTTIYNEPSIRRKEKVVYVYGNRTDDDIEDINPKNSHWFMVDAYEKKIQLHTSDNDREKSRYDVVFDLAEGVVTLKDVQENTIELDSVNGVLTATINEKVHVITPEVVIDCKNTTINASNNVVLNAENDIEANAGNNITATAGSDISASAGGNVSVNAGGNVTVTASGSLEATASSATVSAPNITLNGNVTVNGSLTVSGGFASGGSSAPSSGASMQGPVQVTGNISSDGNITTSGNITGNNVCATSSGNCL